MPNRYSGKHGLGDMVGFLLMVFSKKFVGDWYLTTQRVPSDTCLPVRKSYVNFIVKRLYICEKYQKQGFCYHLRQG